MSDGIENFEIFPKAPIKEAIFEIGYKNIGKGRVAEIEAAHDDFKAHYPDKKEIQTFKHEMMFGEEGAEFVAKSSQVIGYQFWATNRNELHTCKTDGFSYNKLEPYIDGTSAIKKTMDGWEKFSSRITGLEVDRLSVRNLNVINIPFTKFDLEDYVMLFSVLPGALQNNTITNFFFNTSISFPENDALCEITMSPQASGKGVSIVLDIHAQKRVFNKVDLQNELNSLKTIKDKVFFSIITEKCKELFR